MGLSRCLFVVVGCLWLLSSAPAEAKSLAEENIRCGSYLVGIGAARGEVRGKCGDPSDVQERTEYRYVDQGVRTKVWDERLLTEENIRLGRVVPLQIEEWTYNFGPNSFVRYLWFENGRLSRIESGSYGW